MSEILRLEETASLNTELVGAKVATLARLVQAGLPIPRGFCLTTQAHLRLRDRGLKDDPELVRAISTAYLELGKGKVAVRSSAAFEDGPKFSFAGQHDTYLDIEGIDAILQAIERCWKSLENPRARSYRIHHGYVNADRMAVFVQVMIPSEISGVLFTGDPHSPISNRSVIEVVRGVGSRLVSGKTQPKHYYVEHSTNDTIELISDSSNFLTYQADRNSKKLYNELDDEEVIHSLVKIAQMSKMIEAILHSPQDVEFAIAQGQIWILQSRPITSRPMVEQNQLRLAEIHRLNRITHSRESVWSRIQLAETLSEPTPMTWAILKRWMLSTDGAMGRFARSFGYTPWDRSPEGNYDLICGRVYFNLTGQSNSFYPDLQLGPTFQEYKDCPNFALNPRFVLRPKSITKSFYSHFPISLIRLLTHSIYSAWKRIVLSRCFLNRFANQTLPKFIDFYNKSINLNLQQLHHEELLETLDEWWATIIRDFAHQNLILAALTQMRIDSLQRDLSELLGVMDAEKLTNLLLATMRVPVEVDLARALQLFQEDKLRGDDFLHQFGHRCGDELELSQPRWSEAPERVLRHHGSRRRREREDVMDCFASEPRLNHEQRSLILQRFRQVHEYVSLREIGRDHFLKGYALIRKALLELDRRFQLHGGIFFLTPEELPDLIQGKNLRERIVSRRRERSLLLGIQMPSILYSDDLEAIGRSPNRPDSAADYQGTPLCPGVVEGPALVLSQPQETTLDDYVLLCPTMDPAWLPLMTRARAMVSEIGGMLSHGAILARELALPSVSGIPGLIQAVQTGQLVRVDGTRGTLTILTNEPTD